MTTQLKGISFRDGVIFSGCGSQTGSRSVSPSVSPGAPLSQRHGPFDVLVACRIRVELVALTFDRLTPHVLDYSTLCVQRSLKTVTISSSSVLRRIAPSEPIDNI